MESGRQSQNAKAWTRSIAPRKDRILPRLSSLSNFLPDQRKQAESTSQSRHTGNCCAKGELSSGSVEGMNTKAKVALRKSYGFKTDEVYETVLYHELGRLPEHELAHQFC